MKQIILCIALASVMHGQSAHPEWETNGLLNGRFWKAQSDTMKGGFVLGYATGAYDAALLIYARAGQDGKPLLKELFPPGMTAEEVATALDRFYATPENIPVIVNAAIKIIAQRASGVDETTIQRAIANARRAASSGK
jgi:hypothetical protein